MSDYKVKLKSVNLYVDLRYAGCPHGSFASPTVTTASVRTTATIEQL